MNTAIALEKTLFWPIGAIRTLFVGPGETQPVWTLKICEGGSDWERFRYFLTPEQAEDQRVLRGLVEDTSITVTWNPGTQMLEAGSAVKIKGLT